MKGVIIISIVVFILTLLLLVVLGSKTKPKRDIKVVAGGSCSKSCSAIDPVNDPDYNVREAIKQTLLLEQHLAEKSKYCKSCILKHYNLIIGMYEESVWMAGNRCKDYPKLEESLDFCKKSFDKWYKNMDDDKTRLDTLTQLRNWRRDMVNLYYFNGKQPDGHS